MNEHYVINLGRQLGSGGKEIGEKLAQEFGIAFYDKELIKLASEESGLCKEFFEKQMKSFSKHYRRSVRNTFSFYQRRSHSLWQLSEQ